MAVEYGVNKLLAKHSNQVGCKTESKDGKDGKEGKDDGIFAQEMFEFGFTSVEKGL